MAYICAGNELQKTINIEAMPEVIIKYKSEKTFEVLNSLAKYFDFVIEIPKKTNAKKTKKEALSLAFAEKPSSKIDAILPESGEIKEHDMVVTIAKIANVPKGTVGTVVHIYPKGDAYEVEFVINEKSIVETAFKTQIEKK